MCIQDVQLGRAATVLPVRNGDSLTSGSVTVGANNPDRKAWVVSGAWKTLAAVPGVLVVRSRDGTGGIISVLTPYSNTVVVDVSTHGDAAVAPLRITEEGGDDVRLYVSEVVWTQPLKDAVRGYG